MYFRALLLLFLSAARAFASAPEGIPRDLARQRAAQISGVRYQLRFDLVPRANTISGREELTFSLRTAQPVLLDYRDGTINGMLVNGARVSPEIENGHLELSAANLRAGENNLSINFISRVAPAGKAFTRFEDRDDHTEYIYTLFVPMDASMAFPCFDQPDIKARFRLSIAAPASWTIISNTAVETSASKGAARQVTFAETRPLSTYLLAFAAGPFRKVHDRPGWPGLYVRQSMAARAQSEAPEVQQTAAQGIEYLSKYFNQPFPFPKYDMVLIPGFAYGGMEHAGATFLREEAVLFRRAPTHSDLIGRDLLVLHELTHQWFGDFTTMRWFDDLWLKEGFAQYMAYQTLASLKPGENIWKRFYESIKPGAYAIDSTPGTTPIYQDIPNLKDAKSAYGAIVYSKAPGVLKQLAFVLGTDQFRDGLRVYLKDHAYSNAEWSDLVRALEQVSKQPLGPWAEMWIRHRGMPQVDVAWSCGGNRLTRLALSQHDVLGTRDIWPIATQVLLNFPVGPPLQIRVNLNQPSVMVPEATGKPCPQWVFANDQDEAYGRFLLDAASEKIVMEQLGSVEDLFRRTLLWGSLWDGVRQAQLAPRAYLGLAVKLAPTEKDESLLQSILGHTTTALHRYVSRKTRAQFVPGLETLASERMVNSGDRSRRITWFRALRGLAETPGGLAQLKALLDGQLSVPGVELRSLDRWGLVTALIALGDPQADAIFNSEKQRDHSGDGQKYAYAAEAARPDPATKRKYFDDYLHHPARPEDWIEQSLGAFNYWNQSALTEPYLKPALQALPRIKRQRKIFFLMGWLNAFVDSQKSPHAQAEVSIFLQTAPLDKDLQLKILQVKDELDRTVTIRRKFPD
ncbi:MAG TPA: M1 family aminopeptidase [Terriglobia bacterium]|nr:M1 family aminopeptidase [Terriglobia bacterium]